MSKMPEPVAWRSKYKSEPGMIGNYPWSYVEHSLRQPALNNYDIESLITTTQAQAYKDACVREALEEAAKICWEMQSAPEFGKDDKDHWLAIAERRIRALIPPTKNEAKE